MDDRALIPLAGVVVALVALVWPIMRLYAKTGVFAIVSQREADACQRFVGLWFAALVGGVGVWALAIANFGPASLGGWAAPWPVRGAGWLLFAAGLGLLVLAQANMGASWRIGVDDRPTALVTEGMYAWVRNPIYTGMFGMLVGLVLVAPSPWSVMGLAQAYLLLGIQTRLEEQHLQRLHGEVWRAWASHVGRFLPGLGRVT